MAERIYIETTIVSYLTARPSRDVVLAGHQQVTQEWWDTRRVSYELCISQLVLDEARSGDAQAAQERLSILRQLDVLETSTEAVRLAKELLGRGALPMRAADDALHLAIAATNAVPYLLTWNCRHLANAAMRTIIESVCRDMRYNAPIICTPEELSEPKP
jgi:predicted nucleic acid-binding protein